MRKLSKKETISLKGLLPFKFDYGYALLLAVKSNGSYLGICVVTDEDQIVPNYLPNQGECYYLRPLTASRITPLDSIDSEASLAFYSKMLAFSVSRETATDVYQKVLCVLEAIGREVENTSEGVLPFEITHQDLACLAGVTRAGISQALKKVTDNKGITRRKYKDRKIGINYQNICNLMHDYSI